MCRKSKCAYLKDGFCRLHKAACSVAMMHDKCRDAVEKVGKHEHWHERNYLNHLKRSARGEACLHPEASRHDGRSQFKTCKRKRRFPTAERCREVAIHAARKDGMRLAVYECPFCHGYHLTKQLRNHLLWTSEDVAGSCASAS